MAEAGGAFVTRAFERMLKDSSGRKYTTLQTALKAYLGEVSHTAIQLFLVSCPKKVRHILSRLVKDLQVPIWSALGFVSEILVSFPSDLLTELIRVQLKFRYPRVIVRDVRTSWQEEFSSM